VRDAGYRDKMELAYPFHPEVIDILYEKWSTYSTFQRTRGVLRMLANVVEDLYQREVPLDLILPGDINLDRPSIRQEFIKHIGPAYEGVIASDVAGHDAKSRLLDAANKPWKHLAQRIAASIFFHSFSADDAERGINLPYIKLAVLRSDTIPALATDVLNKLSGMLWFLNSRGDAYYFSRIPNLNRMILDKKELFASSYEDEMRQVIQKEIGNKFRPYLWPESSDGIPDNRELKLIVLRPEDAGNRIPEYIKTYLALQDIKREIQSGHSALPLDKQEEVDRRMREISRDYSYNVRRMYHLLRYGDANGGRTLDLGQPVTGRESLDSWFWRELSSSDNGAILTQLHYRTLVNKFLVNNEQLSTSVLLDQFYKNPELPALENQGVLARAIQLGIKDGAFGLVEKQADQIAWDSLKYQTDFPIDSIIFEPEVLLLSRELCEAHLAEISRVEDLAGDVLESIIDRGVTVDEALEIGRRASVEVIESLESERGYRRLRLVVAGIPASKIADLNRGVLLPLSRAVGDFKFTIEIDVSTSEGISQAALENQIKETIRQIGARVVSEEKE